MMKSLILGAIGALMAAPAFAATMTIEFARDSGESSVVTVDFEGTATTADGQTLPYTWNEESMTMCFQVAADAQNCATFAEAVAEPTVGSSVRYTASDGAEGTATITAMTE